MWLPINQKGSGIRVMEGEDVLQDVLHNSRSSQGGIVGLDSIPEPLFGGGLESNIFASSDDIMFDSNPNMFEAAAKQQQQQQRQVRSECSSGVATVHTFTLKHKLSHCS